MSDENNRIFAPHFHYEAIPVQEYERTRIVEEHLENLKRFAEEFRYALALMEFCESRTLEARARVISYSPNMALEQHRLRHESLMRMMAECKPYSAWTSIAAREGARAIYDVFKTLTYIKGNCDKGAFTVKRFLRFSDLNRVISDFAHKYPLREEMRNAALHQADLRKTPGDALQNRSPPGPDPFGISTHGADIRSIIQGRRVVYSINNKFVQYELTNETFLFLEDIQKRTWDIFEWVKSGTFHLKFFTSTDVHD